MNQLLEEKIAAWRHRTIVVLGLGVSNRPLVQLLLENGCRFTAIFAHPFFTKQISHAATHTTANSMSKPWKKRSVCPKRSSSV